MSWRASERRGGLEEALTLFESVSFIGQLLFAVVLETVAVVVAFQAGHAREKAKEPRSCLLSLRFGNGRMEWKGENKPCITLNMRSQIQRKKGRSPNTTLLLKKAMHTHASSAFN